MFKLIVVLRLANDNVWGYGILLVEVLKCTMWNLTSTLR